MRKLISFAFALVSFSATAFPADRHTTVLPTNGRIAFELSNVRYGKNLKCLIKNGRFPSVGAPVSCACLALL
jgi:hypothetical protein